MDNKDDRYNFTEGFREEDDTTAETNQIYFYDSFGRRFHSDRRYGRRCEFHPLGCRCHRCRDFRCRRFF